jgi:hypothetical protein
MKLQKSPKQLLKFSPKAGKIAEKVAEITINHKTAPKN